MNIKDSLDELVLKFNNTSFIEDDPISVPHLFSDKNDIEIAGFLASTIAWGNRKAIVKSSHRMMMFMDNDPFRFVMHASDDEIFKLTNFVHRTFNGGDFVYFVQALRGIYTNHGGIGNFFEQRYALSQDMRIVLREFWELFFSFEHLKRTEKHLSSIAKGAACKRLNMYTRWMVRKDNEGVDFGLWESIPSSALYLPLDVHTANMGRLMGLLTRKQNDWKSVEQITAALREFDIEDPVKYDYALFGAGITKMFDL